MKGRGVIAGAWLGALAAAAVAVTPALGYALAGGGDAPRGDTFGIFGGIGSFTPTSADPALAAALAKSGLKATGFRFTPSEARDEDHHDITVQVHGRTARSSHRAQPDQIADEDDSVRLAPIAYNLGMSVGWKRFALSGDVTHVDLAGQPGSRQAADVGVSYTGRRASARVKVETQKPLDDAPVMVQEAPSSTIDVGGSYSLTRNLDVTAGVRYKSEQNDQRLRYLDDNPRDSQSVYIGAAFRF
ncbi:MAG: hypothetical protein ACTHMG_06950 [Sphingomonas sp.]